MVRLGCPARMALFAAFDSLKVVSPLSRAVSHVPEASRFAWSNGVHRLGPRRDREAPDRLGRHLLGQKLGQSLPLRAKSQGQVPRSRASGPTVYWAISRARCEDEIARPPAEDPEA